MGHCVSLPNKLDLSVASDSRTDPHLVNLNLRFAGGSGQGGLVNS